MKKIITLFSFLLVSLVSLAVDVVYDFSSKIPSPWTVQPAPLGYESDNRGSQFTSDATVTLKGVKNVTKVVVTCSSNIDNQNTLALSVGGKEWGKEMLKKETNVEKTFTGDATSGDISISITRASKSVYIKKVVVTGDVEGTSGNGGNDDTTNKLDPNYKYSEPTTVTPNGVTGSNAAYSFVKNNILVSCPMGGQHAGSETVTAYFGCNAGQTITFTAAKPIKGLVINGMVKKGFAADIDHGELLYVDAEDEDVENNPVLAVLDIDNTSVTITCEKQLRCYNVDFYFEENPELETSDDEEEYTYDWEPDDKTELNITYDELEYLDYTEFIGTPYIDMNFSSEEYEMEIEALVNSVAGTVLPVGTYEISDSGEDGTLLASPGGTDTADYPAFIATDWIYDEEDEVYYYNKAYYLVKGTLKVEDDPAGVKMTLNATTAKGSTVKAVFTGKAINALEGDPTDAISHVKNNDKSHDKVLSGNRIVIRKDGKTYGTMGVQLKK